MKTTEPQITCLANALSHPEAAILVHGPVKCDTSGNSRARQTVFTKKGVVLWTDGGRGSRRSYWYGNENERRAFAHRGGLVLTA